MVSIILNFIIGAVGIVFLANIYHRTFDVSKDAALISAAILWATLMLINYLDRRSAK